MKNIYKKMKYISNSVFAPEDYKSFLNLMSRFPNLSLYNLLLLQYQFPSATLIAGEQAWKDNYNLNVKPDEKAICLLRPELVGDDSLDYSQIGVFDISQLESIPELRKEEYSISTFFYENTGCILSYDNEGLLDDNEDYQFLEDEIIVKQNKALSNEENERNAFICLLCAYVDNFCGLEKENIRDKTIIQSVKYVLCNRYFGNEQSQIKQKYEESNFGYIANCKEYGLNLLNDILNTVLDVIEKIENNYYVELNFADTAFINLLINAELKEDYESLLDYETEDEVLGQLRDKFVGKMELLSSHDFNKIVEDRRNNKMLTQPPYKIKINDV